MQPTWTQASSLALCMGLALAWSAPAQALDDVGYLQEWMTAPDGALILLDLFVPIDPAVAAGLEPAHYDYYVPRTNPFLPPGPPGFSPLNVSIDLTADLFAGVTDGVVVRGLDDASGLVNDGRAIPLFPGLNAPGFPYHLSAIRLATEGYVVAVVTFPAAAGIDMCDRQRWAASVVDHLDSHPTLDVDAFFGMGHSVGGALVTRLTSDAQTCEGLGREDRIVASALLDPTFSATEAAHTEGHDENALLFAQWCRYEEMLYQIEAKIPRVDLVGYTTNPTTGEELELGKEFRWNHRSLFSQGCTIADVVQSNGGGSILPPFGDIPLSCSFEETLALELAAMGPVVEQTTAFFNHVYVGNPPQYPAGGQPDASWVSIVDVPDIPDQPNLPDTYSNICYGVDGALGPVIVDFAYGDLEYPR